MIVMPGEEAARRTFEDLLAQGVVVRPLKAFGLPQCLRISTGTDADNQLCIEAWRKINARNVSPARAD
jgi:histidinol-phosphate aminotransferase